MVGARDNALYRATFDPYLFMSYAATSDGTVKLWNGTKQSSFAVAGQLADYESLLEAVHLGRRERQRVPDARRQYGQHRLAVDNRGSALNEDRAPLWRCPERTREFANRNQTHARACDLEDKKRTFFNFRHTGASHIAQRGQTPAHLQRSTAITSRWSRS